MKKILSITVLMLSLLAPQFSEAQTNAAVNGLDVECLGVEHDGSQTLRVTGRGRNKADAIEQAKKDAIMAVIFTGVSKGRGGCDVRPLIFEANAREKYEDYFNIFFMDRGEYTKYASMEDEKRGSTKKVKSTKAEVVYRVTVRVNRGELKNRLKADGVIKQQDSKYNF